MINTLKNIILLFLFIILITVFTACPTPQQYPIIPEITFKQVILSDSVDLLGNNIKIFKLRFGIIDGDGDIGVQQESDTTGIFDPDSIWHYNNLFTTLYEFIDGEKIEVDEDKQRDFLVPYVVPQGQNKTLIADIFVDIDFTYNSSGELPYDSVQYDFYIVDRSLHISNTEETTIIKLDTIGVFPPIIDEN